MKKESELQGDTEQIIEKKNEMSEYSLLSSVIEKQTAKAKTTTEKKIEGLIVAQVSDILDDGFPVVKTGDNDSYKASFLCNPKQLTVGAQCAIMFQEGDNNKPVIVGVFQNPVLAIPSEVKILQYTTDEKDVIIESEEALHLQCGKARLSLHADGRVEVRGTSIINHSTGLNRIRGASVKIN